jgi:hypothetical protein
VPWYGYVGIILGWLLLSIVFGLLFGQWLKER